MNATQLLELATKEYVYHDQAKQEVDRWLKGKTELLVAVLMWKKKKVIKGPGQERKQEKGLL